MSATRDEHLPGVRTTTGTTRVAIREVREATFRALVAGGASSAEARVAAEQVLFSELHRGSGLVALLQELSRGPWTRCGLTCERDDSDERRVLRVTGPGRPGALRQGALLLDLLAAEADAGTVVVSDGLTSLSPLLDEPLIRTAWLTGCWAVAADRSAASLDFRVAAPDGAVGVGAASVSGHRGPDSESPLPGVSLMLCEEEPGAPTTWLTAVQQRETRAAAARHGRLVDAAVWAEVSTAASAFLVPER